ncbi:flagellin [Halostagnicola sp. A-GB9-2]|uniref:flagellin n=1 Tax=Halostagnicola sp. A-GB9-2 TaxID=3048066 RepID=UPI0024BF998B|nr:flagellin [Halostagnicola sp. A-GB9-2]MDJ1432164.1 flagellin [Halostagnicola sp. A-GB9-2]
MASVSATHLILFIASIVVAAGIAGTLVIEVDNLSGAIETQGSATSTEIETEINIVSDAGQPDSIYDAGDEETNERITLYVKNIGSEHLEAHHSAVDILVNGQYVSSDHTELEHLYADSSSWQTGDVVELTIDLEEANGDIVIDGDTSTTVIVNDNEDSIDFHVENGGE